MTQKHRITCLSCKEEDVITILDNKYVTAYDKEVNTNLLSARQRVDGTWGFECKCGNDNRIGANEVGEINNLVQKATEHQVEAIKRQLLIPDTKQFKMEVV